MWMDCECATARAVAARTKRLAETAGSARSGGADGDRVVGPTRRLGELTIRLADEDDRRAVAAHLRQGAQSAEGAGDLLRVGKRRVLHEHYRRRGRLAG